MWRVGGLVLAALMIVGEGAGAGATDADDTPHGRSRLPVVFDYSSRHVIFPGGARGANVALRNDSRFLQQYLRRQSQKARHRHGADDALATAAVVRDWNVTLGEGSGGTIGEPAKYLFDVNGGPDCVRDYLASGVNVAGGPTQANLIGFNSLYNARNGNGPCTGTGPKVMFAYNIGPGTIGSYIVLSIDGTKIAFNESNGADSYFHILTWASGPGNGTSASAPAIPGVGNAAVDVKLPLPGGVSTAPFIDYDADVAYVTTSDNVVHKYTGVFRGVPAELTVAGTGWPCAVGGSGSISTPIFDSISRHLFFTNSGNGSIDYVDESVTPATLVSGLFRFAPGMSAAMPVIVDSGDQKVFAFSNGGDGAAAVVGQADTSLGAASQVIAPIGAATHTATALMGDFNDDFYYGSSSAARLYVVGNDNGPGRVPALYAIGFDNAFTMNSSPSDGPLPVAMSGAPGLNASSVTAYFNPSEKRQYIFFGVSSACTRSLAIGCLRVIDVTGGAFPTAASMNDVVLPAPGGTGSIYVDDVSPSPGAAVVYYTTLTGNTIVKATLK